MPTIYLYAEVLANIRQANLYASLETHKNEHTKIDISSDKKTVTVRHDGETASIYLPTEIGGTAEVNIPIDRGKEMAVRLELADIMTMPAQENTLHEAPWPAKELSPNARFRCRACDNELLIDEHPLAFKDLPSDHWAEMMDFWHCHKPYNAEPSQSEEAVEAARSKGYGSSNRLRAVQGEVFADTASFLLSKQNCKNIQTSNKELLCSSCKTLLGAEDVSAQGYRIYKSSLSIRPSLKEEWQTFPPELFISSQLLSMTDSSAARKFVVHTEDTTPGLLVWIFNPDIRYSSSRRPEPVVRALKIFYQVIHDAQKSLDRHQVSLEELRLPKPIFESFKHALTDSTGLLPPSARQFKEWTIGLIDRYEKTKSDGLKYFDDVANSAIERSES